VFTLGTAVNHTAWEAAADDYVPVLPLAEAAEDRLYRVTVAGVPVVLLRAGERFFAISATCPHAGGPLDEGPLADGVVECPWHGSRFRLRDGRVLTGPATVDAPRYDVRVRDGQIELRRAGGH
jgi:nitrite reductase/ring-hydroxylating ferredoxin subunit